MSLTHVDCSYMTQSGADFGAAAFVTLNPSRRPGAIVSAGSTAQRENIGSQVACKLAIEHFVEGVLDSFAAREVDDSKNGDHESSVQVLEAAFTRANSSVYSFGHKLAAGGRMAASLIGMVLSDRVAAAARVGEGAAYLFRSGEIFPFFETKQRAAVPEQAQEQLVGAHSLVSVDLASVSIEPEDSILVLANTPNEMQERRLPLIVRGLESGDPNSAQTIVRRVFDGSPAPRFCLFVRLGPDTVYLRKRA